MENYYYEINEPVVSMCAESKLKYSADDSDKLSKMIDFIIHTIKGKYPFIGINIKKDDYYNHYELVFNNHKTFYSYDFTVLLGEIDYLYLTPNKINNIFFTLDYSTVKKENDFKESFICEIISDISSFQASNQANDNTVMIEPEINDIIINNLAA